MLVQAAIALWRTKGFAGTTVADICQAAGVSKALFYFYFPRKEDALLEAGFLSTREARQKWRQLVSHPYELPAVIVAVLATLETTMRRNPPELLIEATLEGHRAEQRALAEGRPDEHHRARLLLLELLQRAQADGKLPADLDVLHLARGAQSLLEAGTRHWASGEYGGRSFAEVTGNDITAFILGHSQLGRSPQSTSTKAPDPPISTAGHRLGGGKADPVRYPGPALSRTRRRATARYRRLPWRPGTLSLADMLTRPREPSAARTSRPGGDPLPPAGYYTATAA